MYDWNWNIILLYKLVFLEGALITIALALTAIICGTLLGIIIAFFKKSRNLLLSSLGQAYIEIFRSLPILVLLIIIFYIFPILNGWILTPFTTAALALSLHLSSFVAETVRAGLESIPRAQSESGLALGMTRRQIILYIVAPQAVKNMIPNLLGLYIQEIKNSSLASVIAVNELLHRSNILISETYRPLEIYTTLAAVYLIIIIPVAYLTRLIERKLTITDKKNYEINY